MIDHMQQNGIAHTLLGNDGLLDNFTYSAGDRATLVDFVQTFWGDNGDDEKIEAA